MKALLLTTTIWAWSLAAWSVAAGEESPTSGPASTIAGAEATDDVLDLILLGPTYPLRLRLHLEVNGTPFRDVWRKSIEQSLDGVDRNSDKTLSPPQVAALAAKFGQPNVAMQTAASRFELSPSAAAMPAAQMKAPQGLSRDAALKMLLSIPALTVQNKLASRGAGAALFPLLDLDGDGRLSRAELDAAPNSLRCRDFNDDLLLTEQELIQGPPQGGQSRGNDANIAEGVLLVVDPTTTHDALIESLLFRYDRNRDGELGYGAQPAEIRFPTDQYAKLDRNQDQRLDRTELTALLESPPEIELDFQLGRRSTSSRRLNRPAAADSVFEVRRKLDGGYRLSLAGNEINLRRNNRDPLQAVDPPRLRNYDQDNDGMLTAEELPPESGIKFSLVDQDGNGKVSREEFDEYHRQQAASTAARIVLEVSDQGQDLFTRIDQNGDQILSPRELTTARQLLATDDADRDGFVSNFEIPYNVTLELSRGGTAATAAAMLRQPPRERQPKKDSAAAPDWFTRTDRNGDGDLSPAEFLGSRDTFNCLDSNHDGLLDPAEAMASHD